MLNRALSLSYISSLSENFIKSTYKEKANWTCYKIAFKATLLVNNNQDWNPDVLSLSPVFPHSTCVSR